ncbi:MAG: hypothetical protein RL532_617 [Actinomycetota bacterium]
MQKSWGSSFLLMPFQVIVVSGSLRKASFTTALCRAVCALPASS